MRGPINVKSLNNITNWQMRFNSAFKGLKVKLIYVSSGQRTLASVEGVSHVREREM
jgi:hypothetical protein